jgi:hypothetical protein
MLKKVIVLACIALLSLVVNFSVASGPAVNPDPANGAVNVDSRYNFQMPRRTELMNIFNTYNVDAVFAGHLHFNAYGIGDNFEMISTSSCTCGLGSSPTTPGIRIINVYSNYIEQEYRTLDSIP